MGHLVHLSPLEAVAEAGRHEHPDMAAQRLDRYLRGRLLDYLQNRLGDRVELAKALVAARAWAVRENKAYVERWSLLLEVLEDSRSTPSTVEQMQLLTEGEEVIVGQLVSASHESSQLRPRDLAARVGKSEQNVNNYLRRLEKAGLVVRHRVPGQRAVLVFPTHKAIELASRLGVGRADLAELDATAAPVSSMQGSNLAPEVDLWHLN